jgi:hypothetical protein
LPGRIQRQQPLFCRHVILPAYWAIMENIRVARLIARLTVNQDLAHQRSKPTPERALVANFGEPREGRTSTRESKEFQPIRLNFRRNKWIP